MAVLALTAFNLTFRLGSETLSEWDDSLYATTAFELVQRQEWVATTSDGALDYSNSKPPLNVWLIALSIKTFGTNLFSLRIASVLSAWLTVLVLMVWAGRRFGSAVGMFAGLVLATCFGFLYVHSGRSANPDSLLTLFLLLVLITLDTSSDRPWRRVWLGPLLAGVFLLKGMAVLLPLGLIAFAEARRRLGPRERWAPLAVAFACWLVPVGAWAIARYRVDRWTFFERIFFQDFVALSTTALDAQSGSVLFYLDILQKHHYDWIIAALTAVILFPPPSWGPLKRSLAFWKGTPTHALIGCWALITLVVPTLMQTKMPWYLNPFYPIFALGVGWVLSYGFSRVSFAPARHRWLLVAMIAMAATVAEAKLIWYSYHYRALDRSVQGLLLVEADRVRGSRVFRSTWDRADAFVLKGIVTAERADAATVEDFLQVAMPGDYLVTLADVEHPDLVRVRALGDYALYRLRD